MMKITAGILALAAIIGVGGATAYDLKTGNLGIIPPCCKAHFGCVTSHGCQPFVPAIEPDCCTPEGACPSTCGESSEKPCCATISKSAAVAAPTTPTPAPETPPDK